MLVYLSMIEGPEDRNKFEIVYEQYKNLMYYVAYRILREERDAEDAVHNAFVRIAEHIEKISEPVCPKTRSFAVLRGGFIFAIAPCSKTAVSSNVKW